MSSELSPFVDLPAALVEEVLEKSQSVSDVLLRTFQEVRAERAALRQRLVQEDLLQHESELGYPPPPTTCGTDGSYAVERLLSADLVVAVAVAVEGLTPPSETRYWEQPHHATFVQAEPHYAETATVLRAIMLGNELTLATKAPHDLVMLDMTLTLPVIYFNQALNLAPKIPSLHSSEEFLRNCVRYLEDYATILRAERSDKNYIGLPKYSTRREVGQKVGWPAEHDDRGLLTLLLQPGELTRPIPLQQPDQEWHLNTERLPTELRRQVNDLVDSIVTSVNNICVVYYKPHEWLPALRVEMPYNVAQNPHRLASVIMGLKHQCATPSMLEPYPLYMADRMAKAASRAVPAFRQVTTQRLSEKYEGDIGEVFFAMHGYRSEEGR